jgi:hypothetical protein
MDEPKWMQKISNATVCNFFYFFFVLYAIFTVLALVVMFGTFFAAKKLGTAGIIMSVQSVLTFLLGTSFMAFYYMICDRALLPLAAAKPQEPFMGHTAH